MKTVRSLIIKVILILISITLIGILIATTHSKNATSHTTSADDGKEYLKTYIQIQKEGIQLTNKLGSDNNYAQIYIDAKTEEKIKGKIKTQAIAVAANQFINKKALVEYAQSRGITCTEQEVNDYIRKIIDYSKDADNFEEIQRLCKDADITYEETYWSNRETYKTDYIIDKLYKLKRSEYMSAHNISSPSEDEEKEWQKTWEHEKETIVNSYKGNENYKADKLFVEKVSDLYLSNKQENVSAINTLEKQYHKSLSNG